MSIQAQEHLETLFILDARGRIVSTREPHPTQAPGFVLIRRSDSFAWAIGAGVPEEPAREVERLARDECPTCDFRQPPKHRDKYLNVLGGEFKAGPAFEFPEQLPIVVDAVLVEDIELLRGPFNGWTADELPGRSPIMVILEDGRPVSICFCARVSELSVEAGVETVPAYRGRGFAGMATNAWAAVIQASGLTPIYSTSWTNSPSLAVAHRLGLVACASYWSLVGASD